MTEWGTSPWATTSHPASLSPAPPAFAKTSPSLSHTAVDSGYFNAFVDEAAWGDPGTPAGIGGVGNVLQDGTLGIQSPRPIASPGRIANGKGNRWLRPVGSMWEEEEEVEKQDDIDIDTSHDAAALDATDDTQDVHGASNQERRSMEEVTNADYKDHKSLTGADPWSGDGLGIEINDARLQDQESEEQQDLQKDVCTDENYDLDIPVQKAQTVEKSTVADPVTDERDVGTLDSEEGHLVEAHAKYTSDKVAREAATEDPTPEARTPIVNFDIDMNILNSIFPSTSPSTVQQDLSDYESLISTSSGRKTHFRLTRPYSLRQYNQGDFDKYTRVTWRESAVHDKVIQIMSDWIAKDRASGGMFSVPSAKRRSLNSFGWGNEEKREEQALVVSASSILLPKISGPAGFGWSSSTMTPLTPSKPGDTSGSDTTPRASEEIARMSPRPRRTPIRKARAISRKLLSSPQGSSMADALYDLESFERARTPVQTLQVDAAGTEPSTGMQSTHELANDDFGIFEEAVADFEDFTIAPPPAVIATPPAKHVPKDEMSSTPTKSDDVLTDDLDDDHATQESGAQMTVNGLHEDADEEHSRLKDGRDESTTFKSAVSPPLPPASPSKANEKEGLFNDGGENGLDDFDDFESAPPLEYTDAPEEKCAKEIHPATTYASSPTGPPVDNSSHVVASIEPTVAASEPEIDSVNDEELGANYANNSSSSQIVLDDFSVFDTAAPEPSTAAQITDTTYDDFAMSEKSLTPTPQPIARPDDSFVPTKLFPSDTQPETKPLEPSRSATPQAAFMNGVTDHREALSAHAAEHSNTLEDDDDDFGAFEDAIASAEPQGFKPAGMHDDSALNTRNIATTPHSVHVPFPAAITPPQSAAPLPHGVQPSQPASVATTIQTPHPLPQPRAISLPLHSKPTTATKPNAQTPSTSAGADRGNALLNMLTLLDESESAAHNHEDDFHDWDEGEGERLAGEKEIGRLRREEWVGERPAARFERGVGGGMGIAKEEARSSIDVVDRETVEKVVNGLPDWSYMLR